MRKSPKAADARRILVIAPHPDDETIGCGGTLLRHHQRGDRLTAVYLTSGELGLKQLPPRRAWAIREREARRAARILGIATLHFLRAPDWFVGDALKPLGLALAALLRKARPELVYVPHANEWHPDHKAALPLLRAALQRTPELRPEVRAYEVWTPMADHEMAENITRVMPSKLKALRAHESQLHEFDYERAVRGLNAFRGELAARCRYAEVFKWETLPAMPAGSPAKAAP